MNKTFTVQDFSEGGEGYSYLPAAEEVAKRLNTALPTMHEVEKGKMECYHFEAVETSNAYDKKKREIPVKFPYMKREICKPPYRMQRCDAARGRTGWQIVTFNPSEFLAWFNNQI